MLSTYIVDGYARYENSYHITIIHCQFKYTLSKHKKTLAESLTFAVNRLVTPLLF